MQTEWARSADDVLLRRTKIGLRTTPAMREKLDDYMNGGPSKM